MSRFGMLTVLVTLSVAGGSAGQTPPTNVLVVPLAGGVGPQGGRLVCPEDGSYRLAVLPVTYAVGESAVEVRTHSCIAGSEDPFCQETSKLAVRIEMADVEAPVQAEADPGDSAAVCVRTAASDETCQEHPAPVVRVPAASLGEGGAATLVGIRHLTGTFQVETTRYNAAAAQAAFHPVIGPGVGNVTTPVHFGRAGEEGCS